MHLDHHSQLLDLPGDLLLLLYPELDADGPYVSVEDLRDYRRVSPLDASCEHPVDEVLQLRLDGVDLDLWPTTPAPLAALRAVATAVLCVVGVVDVAVSRAVDRYSLAGGAGLGDTRAFSH